MTAKNGKAVSPIAVIRPNSIESEQAALGAALISRSAFEHVVSLPRRDVFFIEAHRTIYDTLVEMHAQETVPDIVSLPEALRTKDKLDSCGGMAYIGTLAESVPTAAHVDYYLKTILEKWALRQLLDVSGTLKQMVDDRPGEVLEIGRRAELLLRTALAPLRVNGKFDSGVTADALMRMILPPMKWIVPGLIGEGLTIISGKGKMGKSWLCYQVSLAVAFGGIALGNIPVEAGRVLYLALEDTHRRLQGRLTRILDGAEAPENLHLFRHWPRMNQGGQRDLIDWFKQYPDTRLVIIDTFAKIRSASDAKANAYDEDYRAMGEVKEVADAHGAGLVVIHHFNKMRQAEDWVDQVSGSIGISAAADGIIGFFRERGKKDAILKVTGRDIDDESDQAIVWSEHGGPWVRHEGVPEEIYRTQEESEVVEALNQHGPLKPSILATLLGIKPDAARSRMSRMFIRGRLGRTPEGIYYVPTQNTQLPVTPATGATCDAVTPHVTVTGVAERAGVTGVAVNGTLPVALTLDPTLPAAEADLRQTTYNLAWAHHWPALATTNGSVSADPDDWAHVCGAWSVGLIRELRKLLEGLE